MGNYPSVLDPSRLSMGAGWEALGSVCLGLAAVFVIIVILYFLLRGRSRYD